MAAIIARCRSSTLAMSPIIACGDQTTRKLSLFLYYRRTWRGYHDDRPDARALPPMAGLCADRNHAVRRPTSCRPSPAPSNQSTSSTAGFGSVVAFSAYVWLLQSAAVSLAGYLRIRQSVGGRTPGPADPRRTCDDADHRRRSGRGGRRCHRRELRTPSRTTTA